MLIGDVILVLAFLGTLGWGASAIAARRQHGLAARVPPGVGAANGVELSQVTKYYRLAKRMAHELDAVIIVDDQIPCLSDHRREVIKKLLDEWESM